MVTRDAGDQCCQVRGFPAELGYSFRGMFFMSAGWGDPNNVIFSPWNATFTQGNPAKKNYFTPRNKQLGYFWASFE